MKQVDLANVREAGQWEQNTGPLLPIYSFDIAWPMAPLSSGISSDTYFQCAASNIKRTDKMTIIYAASTRAAFQRFFWALFLPKFYQKLFKMLNNYVHQRPFLNENLDQA